MSSHLLVVESLTVASALVALGVSTTLLNLFRILRDRRAATRIAQLRPQLLAALVDDSRVVIGTKPRDKAAFIRLVRSLVSTLRGADRERLSHMLEEAGAVDSALLDVQSRSPVRRARAAELLGLAAIERAVPSLMRLLHDGDADVRRAAARALGLIGDPVAVPALLRTIDGPHHVPLNTATMALLRMPADALEPLIDGLQVGTVGVRAACAELLGLRGSVAALPALATALERDEALEVRIRAARALGRIGVPSSVDVLAGALRSDEPVALRAVAVRALGQIGGRRTVAQLRDALSAPEHVVAMNAAHALATIPDGGTDALVRVGRELTSRRGAFAREALSYLSLDTANAEQR
jgi:HEAT repeat protein